jgi:Phage tail assembly chaperone protein
MKVWTFYRVEDGLFNGSQFEGSEEHLQVNLPPGYAALEGRYDYLSQRVDLETGDVVDYQPPAPPDTEFEAFTWNPQTKRWVSTPTTAAIARDVRQERDRRIAATDWVLLRSFDQGVPVPQAWLDYRQALRDVTTQLGFPTEVIWPISP